MKNGYYADTGISFVVGKVDDPMKEKVCEVAKEAFYEGIKHAVAGRKINQIGKHVHKKIKGNNTRKLPGIVMKIRSTKDYQTYTKCD